MQDNTSIDHFIPKSHDPQLGYIWSNFRLCRTRLNHRKKSFFDVADPVNITDDWFILDFTSFLIKPNKTKPRFVVVRAHETIKRFELNVDRDYVVERMSAVGLYTLGRITIHQLRTKYPFIAKEMVAQNFDTTFRANLRVHFQNMMTTGSWSPTLQAIF
jgi:hypothetical protein